MCLAQNETFSMGEFLTALARLGSQEKDVEAGSAEPPKASWNTVEGFVPRHVPLNHATQPQDPNIRDLGSAISEMQIEADQAKRGSRLETSDHDLQPIREKDEVEPSFGN